ncbi:Glutamate N-acetyltransferase @ N-acetylglutamate synthase [hydrothermal vent metagenome]|uniref:Glutamate N-acetyltransferase @ N-acetylglutamate synthase n=1 Tax=hydrothermal vent metagenome TaxID=652676 RepID=A0A3B1AYK0_9ZZZZ
MISNIVANSKKLNLLPIAGIKLGTTCANIKYPNRKDLVLIELSDSTSTAAVFTKNQFCAAPVIISKQHLQESNPRYLLINTGNANAGTGQRGLDDSKQTCLAVASSANCNENQVLVFSTGVIGENLAMDKILAGIPQSYRNLSDTSQSWADAAQGIMTTDTVAKGHSTQLTIAGKAITITGIAKGSGMIRPDMATMLAYIATDAKVKSSLLQQCLQNAVDKSFNRITVDGDTSTNDSCLLLASGASKVEITADNMFDFQLALTQLCENLAKDMIRDGEGATKLITLNIINGSEQQECIDLAYLIAHSPLVKTAFFASDPNWGRLLAVVGRADIKNLDLTKIKIYLDDLCIVSNGGRDSGYTEEVAQKIMDQTEITVTVDLARSDNDKNQATVWTCDFSTEYVRINAEYRT